LRRVGLMMSVSVDGFVARPHGHAGALPEPDELKRWKLERARRAGTHHGAGDLRFEPPDWARQEIAPTTRLGPPIEDE
jgi:hypothetical protein